MHDELEGSLKEHLSVLLRWLLQKKLVMRSVINHRLEAIKRHDLNSSKLDLPIVSDRDAERLASGELLGRRGKCDLCLFYCCIDRCFH